MNNCAPMSNENTRNCCNLEKVRPYSKLEYYTSCVMWENNGIMVEYSSKSDTEKYGKQQTSKHSTIHLYKRINYEV